MGTVTTRLRLTDEGYSAGVQRGIRSANELRKSLEGVGHGSVSGMQAASASLRLLENGISGNIRAAERFASMIPGLGTAMANLFPVVGAITFGGVLYKTYEEVTAFIQKAKELPTTIARGFEGLTLSAQSSVAQINVVNDKLENQIAKLEHKPENNMKLAIDEARVSADEFAKSVEQASKNVQGLLEANNISKLQSFFADTEETKTLGGTIKPYELDKQHLSAQAAIQRNLGNESGYQDYMKQFRDKEQSELQKLQDVLAESKRKAAMTDHGMQVYQNQSAIQNTAQGTIDQILLSRSRQTALDRQASDRGRLDQDQKAQQAAEEAKKAQEQLLKIFEEGEKRQNAFNKLTINGEIQFWSDRIAAFTKGSQQYIQVQDKIYDLIASRPSLFSQNKKNQDASGKSQVEGNNLMAAAAEALRRFDADQLERSAKSSEQYNQEAARGVEIQQRAMATYRETSIQIALQQGAISKLTAAQALASLHETDHAQAIKRVNDALAEQIRLINQQPDSKVSSEDKRNQVRNAQQSADNTIAGINGDYSVQSQRDQAAMSGATIPGAVRNALQSMITSFDDMASKLASVIPQSFESLNSNIIAAITGHGSKAGFGRALSGIGNNLLGIGLQGLEGKILGSIFHPGANSGASSIGLSSPARTATVGMADLIPGASALFRPFIDSLPHLAAGGDVTANFPHIVGESGPELFVPRAAGRIVPNGQMGGGVHHHYHIVVQGSNDPGAIQAAIHRGVGQAMAGSAHMHHETSRRTPRGR